MSAFFSIGRPDGVALFSDGAAADGGILIADLCKIVTGDGVAVTGRGPANLVFGAAEAICDFADDHGPEAAVAAVQDFAWRVRDDLEGDDRSFEILIAACLPGIGGVHRYFQSTATIIRQTGQELDAFEVYNPGVIVNSIGRLTADVVERFRPRHGDTLEACARREGLAIMDWMRQIPTSTGAWGIGGHVDMALLTAEGVAVEMVHNYGDPIGEAIDPFRGMTRAERRRVERMVA